MDYDNGNEPEEHSAALSLEDLEEELPTTTTSIPADQPIASTLDGGYEEQPGLGHQGSISDSVYMPLG